MINSNNLILEPKIEIGILEIRRHIPVLYTFMKICKTDKTNVTIFITRELLSRLEVYIKDKGNYEFVVKEKNESIRSFLKRVVNICNKKIDLLFVNTIHEFISDLLSYLKFNPESKTVLVVHHANAWLKPKLIFDIKHIPRTIYTNISSVLIKKFIFPKFAAINVIYYPIKEYILKNMYFDKKIFTLPTSIFEEKTDLLNQTNNKNLKIAIPGLIEKHRKDLLPVINAFENLSKNSKEKLEIYLLGEPADPFGRLVQKRFKKLRKEFNKILLFDSFVSDEIFDKFMIESDIILAPIRIKTRSDIYIEEEYGKTVGSGVIYNAIRFAKPIIVPKEFNMLKELSSSTLTYETSDDLCLLLNQFIKHPEKLKKLKIEALKNAQKFSLKNLQDYFEKNVLTWLKSN